MQKSLFFRLGELIYRFRTLIVIAWLLIFASCIPLLPNIMAPFHTGGFSANGSESARAYNFLEENLNSYQHQLLVLYHSDKYSIDDPQYLQQLHRSLHLLRNFPIQHEIIYPTPYNKQIASDQKTAYVVIFFKDKTPLTHQQITQLQQMIITPEHMSWSLGGDAVFNDSVTQQTTRDLYHADKYALPLSILVFILVFGSIVAAIMPLLMGGGCALVIFIGLYILGNIFNLSVFTINIALLLGLCLSLDYSLFIISRFKEELTEHNTIKHAISRTLATAGKAIFFSGLAVLISLSALLIFPINILFSIGLGGITAVIFAVLLALTLLPACLCLLQHNINSIALYHPEITPKNSLWQKFATIVVTHRLIFFCLPLLILLVLSYPILNITTGISGYKILTNNCKNFFDNYTAHFNANNLTPITMIVSTKQKSILSSHNIQKIYQLTHMLQQNKKIAEVHSITTVIPNASEEQYVMLYKQKPKSVEQLLKITTGKQFSVITIMSRYDVNSKQTKQLLQELRSIKLNNGLKLALTGMPVMHADVLEAVAKNVCYALCWIMLLTYAILLCLLRSVLLPLKAIIMTLLSLSASYGVLVFVFQEGHLQNLLHFQAQGIIDLNLLIIMFCALFGFSMDYEVFLLTRIHEHYLQTNNAKKSIVYGIVKSSRIISSAAIIVMVLCGSFMVADVMMVKAFGLGIAVAIFVDAFIIRTLLVPAIMAIFNQWSWYFPIAYKPTSKKHRTRKEYNLSKD